MAILSKKQQNLQMKLLGSYNPLLLIVIIRTVNVPQIKQTNKLKAQTNPLIQQTKETN